MFMNECGGGSWRAGVEGEHSNAKCRNESAGGTVTWRVTVICRDQNPKSPDACESGTGWRGGSLLMAASLCLLAQVLHLQNKQVVVVSTTVASLPPSAPGALMSLCL